MVQGVVVENGCLVNTNPATGEEISRVTSSTPEQVEEMIAKANAVQSNWAYEHTCENRIELLKKGLQVIADVSDKLAESMVQEMGKPICEAEEEMECAVDKKEFFEILQQALEPKTHGSSTVVRSPFGVAAILSPWNFPVDEILLLALPSLASGNTGKCKAVTVDTCTEVVVISFNFDLAICIHFVHFLILLTICLERAPKLSNKILHNSHCQTLRGGPRNGSLSHQVAAIRLAGRSAPVGARRWIHR
jgi:acyl-CoA reductase-like NAD-dependent aldehyde dehydrogenase